MGYFGSEGIYDSNLSFWGQKFKKKFLDPTQLLENAPNAKFWLNCLPWPNKSEGVAELWGAESFGL